MGGSGSRCRDMNELALYCGAGGGLLGSVLLGWHTLRAVEIEPYCREVVLRRQRDGVLPLFPIWDDIRSFDGAPWRGCVDIITAGFPCQPFSLAGQRKGEADERNLWPETIRVIREVGPRFALLENVPGLLAHPYFGTILGDLAESGYDARWDVLGADDAGAPHRRKRLWILAYAECDGREQGTEDIRTGQSIPAVRSEDVDDSTGARQHRRQSQTGRALRNKARSMQSERRSRWPTEPAVGRVAHGVAHRVDRLRALGNGQVPGVVRAAWHLLRMNG